jgi:thiamine biosynthesis lipoprotein
MKVHLLIKGLSLLILFSCGNSGTEKPITQSCILMDTIVRISVYENSLSKQQVQKALDLAFQEMEKVEEKTSAYMDSSDLFKIEKMAGRHWVSVSPGTFGILQQSLEISKKTHGSFDVTIGTIKKIWGFDSENPSIPDSALIHACLSRMGNEHIRLGDNSVFLKRTGIHLDLGGAAKGYIIDRGVDILRKAGIRSGIVDAGGDMRIFGRHPIKKHWTIGLQHPREPRNVLLAEVHTSEASIATSGDYERFFEEGGIRYHHILDPETGFPANECVSVTIVAQSAFLADAYATAVFVMGPEKGMALIESEPSLEGLIVFEVDGQLKTVISPGLQENIHFY